MGDEVIDICASPSVEEQIANYDLEISNIMNERNAIDDIIDECVRPRLYRITYLSSRLRFLTIRRNNLIEAERFRIETVANVALTEQFINLEPLPEPVDTSAFVQS